MPQILLTGQLKLKPTYRVWCLYSLFVHAQNDLSLRKYCKKRKNLKRPLILALGRYIGEGKLSVHMNTKNEIVSGMANSLLFRY